MHQNEYLQEQQEELLARMLKLHARFRVADPDTYEEAMAHLRDVSTIATDMADSLQDRLQAYDEGRKN